MYILYSVLIDHALEIAFCLIQVRCIMMTYLLIGPFIVIENKRHLCVKRKTPQKRNFVQKYGKYAPSESRTHDPWFTRPVL